jgi:hypothetical protein
LCEGGGGIVFKFGQFLMKYALFFWESITRFN